jgi:hypothetical protein
MWPSAPHLLTNLHHVHCCFTEQAEAGASAPALAKAPALACQRTFGAGKVAEMEVTQHHDIFWDPRDEESCIFYLSLLTARAPPPRNAASETLRTVDNRRVDDDARQCAGRGRGLLRVPSSIVGQSAVRVGGCVESNTHSRHCTCPESGRVPVGSSRLMER